jgi:hypothetical protein
MTLDAALSAGEAEPPLLLPCGISCAANLLRSGLGITLYGNPTKYAIFRGQFLTTLISND